MGRWVTDNEFDRLEEAAFGPTPGRSQPVREATGAGEDELLATFRRVGLSETAARLGVRGLREGELFSFEDAVVVLADFDSRTLVDWSRVQSETKRLGGGQVIAERRTATQVRPVLVEAATASVNGNGTLSVVIIDAGQGSSGYYPPQTLKAAAESKVFGKGLHMYLDHPTSTEQYERPERSVRDLAGALASDAWWDEGAQALRATAEVFAAHRAAIEDMAPHIGLSIRAGAVVAFEGGQSVVKQIDEAYSVDFVTKAGRGGRIE